MAQVQKTKINRVFVTGTIEEVNTQVRSTADGRQYINGKVVIKSVINDVENLIEMKVLAFEKTKSGAISKKYESYTKLDGQLGKKVKVSGEFREGSMVDQSGGSVRHFNEIYLNFINSARSEEEDCATFEYSGFVVKPLYERKNREDELLNYRIEVAQSNWNDSSIQVIKFDVDKNDLNIAQAIEANYLPGTTVQFNGEITYTSHTEQKTEEVAFGEPIVKKYVVSEKVFKITSGKEPFGEEDPSVYTNEEIKAFVENYKAADVERLEKNSIAESAPAPAPANNAAMSKLTRTTSLI